MKQIIQDISNGKTSIEDVPRPRIQNNSVLIASSKSLLSSGTERMLLNFSKANIINKAYQQPEKVKQVLEKIKTDGLASTMQSVRSKLDQPIPLGYCNAGIVVESGVVGYKKGDRVISNGNHAEMVKASCNLIAKIPDNVDDECAAFTVLGAIGLQGIRLLKPSIGETIVVTGLGLVGLMCVQILKANGCRVLGIDYDNSRCELARSFGVDVINLSKGEDPISIAKQYSNGHGVDGVLITAATKSNEPVDQAATMCRKRGRIVLVGVSGLQLSRDDFYKKELIFQVSCSYGPGRYDPEYEEKGHDYPFGFVRWTEKRNFEAVLELMCEGKLDVKSLITHRFPFEDAIQAYDLISSDENSLGIIFEYNQDRKAIQMGRTILLGSNIKKIEGTPTLSFIGAGNYAGTVLIPAFKKQKVNLKTIVSSSGLSSTMNGKKFGFEHSTTDSEIAYKDKETDAVIITTRHNTHADFVIKSIENAKHVFVEKPLAINVEELEAIQASNVKHPSSMLMVGFNRRFSTLTLKIKEILGDQTGPISMVMTVNAGFIPPEHWTNDPEIGGGRIIGEACHFIDLLRYLAGCPISYYQNIAMNSPTNDTVTLQLSFENGSIGTIHYFTNGNRSISKERLELFSAGRVLQLDNFIKLKAYGVKGFKKMSLRRQDKGQNKCAKAFIDAIKNGSAAPIPLDEILEVAKVTINLSEPH